MTHALDIGVLTLHRCINYGSYWQARCLLEGLRQRGHRAVLLDHDCPRARRAEWRCALNPLLPHSLPGAERRRYARKTRRFFAAQENLPRSPRFPLDAPRSPGHHEVVVVGSDEVWNTLHPWYGNRALFFGKGINAARLVSYAASFGTHAAGMGLDAHWTEQLRHFSAISVRDENSRRLIRQAVGREASLVLDPCLQFPPQLAEPAGEGDYALVYGHGFPEWFARAVRNWADARGLRLLSVGYGNAFADEQRIEACPEEFARLMAGARAVATNFFHGCVFALINAKPFACVGSWYRFNKIRDLLCELGANAHVVGGEAGPGAYAALLDTPLDPCIGRRIGELRHSSQGYLDHALG
ncbi:polysaccharide pyruvyl transferase family protein [Aestuariivirga sp.]|uniref:polysaccharide pyruvyl transferase family protein n=1 Tax=Aestuariivirga sp. TaxID=2650926 RepID=UPI00391AF5F8